MREPPASSPTFADAISAAVDVKRLAELVAMHTNDDMQAVLASRRKAGVPGGLGDSRAIRKAIHANVVEQVAGYIAALVGTIELPATSASAAVKSDSLRPRYDHIERAPAG